MDAFFMRVAEDAENGNRGKTVFYFLPHFNVHHPPTSIIHRCSSVVVCSHPPVREGRAGRLFPPSRPEGRAEGEGREDSLCERRA